VIKPACRTWKWWFPIINGLIFVIPFLWDNFFFLIFTSFTLLFWATDKIKSLGLQLLYVSIVIIIWKFSVMHWIYSDDLPLWSSIVAILITCVTAFIPFLLYFYIINKLCIPTYCKYFLFAFVWISIEWLTFEWELAFPFHTIGYYLGNAPVLIQWYQYIGVLGGSAWILFINIAVLKWLDIKAIKTVKWGYVIIAVIPIVVSVWLYLSQETPKRTEKLLAVSVKFDKEHTDNNTFHNTLTLLSSALDTHVFLAVCPESICYLPSTSFPHNTYFSSIKKVLKQQAPEAGVVFGASTQDIQGEASFHNKNYFNMALCCNVTGWVGFRNKVRLVPFGEFIPYKAFLGRVPSISSLVKEPLIYKDKYDLTISINGIEILPLICYELYFYNIIAKHIQNTNIALLVAISNDHAISQPIFAQQLIRMTKVQAISFQKSIIKSAEFGISLIISPQGKTLAQSKHNTSETISTEAPINNSRTLFGKHGNYMAYLFTLILFLLISLLHYGTLLQGATIKCRASPKSSPTTCACLTTS
jgi:apolipoprotein N-acyltransferase